MDTISCLAFSIDALGSRTEDVPFEIPSASYEALTDESFDQSLLAYRLEVLPKQLFATDALRPVNGRGCSHFVKADDFAMLGYQSHNHRELRLMLEGTKPMSVFAVSQGATVSEVTGQDFDRFVSLGELIRHRKPIQGKKGNPDWDYLMYVLPNERWRIPAMELVYGNGLKYGFDVYLEAMISELLGYSQQQIDRYVAFLRK
ncbi:MAG: hypothetical protein JJ884_14650 [Maricaulis sp.]|uniref:hypothetical protein n=1 Tax=Maricaulis sp. TaxID=1486257 RepID=UPI001B0F52CF|nr:hypothetical protein [Maricaulis sp.]MBO6730841.1 hypothetical protein [Maricaulis sp.]MBO6848745.1 hypothetical protein [Maricaulis sp.]MBO6878726.1 hypothetical protein [Maricaulis sp.]